MANGLYDFGRQGFLDGSIDWDTDDIRVMLMLSTYTLSQAHEFVSDIATYDNGRSAALASKTVAAGVADAADTTLNATAAAACKALVIYKYNAADASARLIAYIDTPTSGLPFTPSAGQAVPIAWDNGANKIFKL
jgi:hypothetical protein